MPWTGPHSEFLQEQSLLGHLPKQYTPVTALSSPLSEKTEAEAIPALLCPLGFPKTFCKIDNSNNARLLYHCTFTLSRPSSHLPKTDLVQSLQGSKFTGYSRGRSYPRLRAFIFMDASFLSQRFPISAELTLAAFLVDRRPREVLRVLIFFTTIETLKMVGVIREGTIIMRYPLFLA